MIHVIETTQLPPARQWHADKFCRCGEPAHYAAPRLERVMCATCAARVCDFTPLIPIEAIRGRTPDP